MSEPYPLRPSINEYARSTSVVQRARIVRLNSAQIRLRGMLIELHANGFIKGRYISIGRTEKRMKDFAAANGIELASGHLYMGPKSISHAMRTSKIKRGGNVSDQDLIAFVKDCRKMDLFWDGEAFVYTDYKNKFIIHPNYALKIDREKVRKVVFVTSEKVRHPEEFKLPKYKKV